MAHLNYSLWSEDSPVIENILIFPLLPLGIGGKTSAIELPRFCTGLVDTIDVGSVLIVRGLPCVAFRVCICRRKDDDGM